MKLVANTKLFLLSVFFVTIPLYPMDAASTKGAKKVVVSDPFPEILHEKITFYKVAAHNAERFEDRAFYWQKMAEAERDYKKYNDLRFKAKL